MERVKIEHIQNRLKKREPLLDGWFVQEALGSGSFGVVFRVTKTRLFPEQGALKVLELTRKVDRRSLGGSTGRKRAIEGLAGLVRNDAKEIISMKDLSNHPRIVRYFGHDHFIEKHEAEVSVYILILMELMEANLDGVLSQRALSEQDTVQYGIELLDALDHVHAQRYLHRDIKPENIFLHKGHAYLGDFGISKKCGESMQAQSLAGTDEYMAPEVFRNPSDTGWYDHRADLYSLGLVLYEMVEKNLPYYTEGIAELQRCRRTNKEIEFTSDVSFGFREVVRKSLRADPEERFSTAREMQEALKGVGKKKETISVPSPSAFKKPEPDSRLVGERERLVREVQNALSASNLESARAWLQRLEAHLGEWRYWDSEYAALQEAIGRLTKRQEEETTNKNDWEDRREELIEATETAVNGGNAKEARRCLDLWREHLDPSKQKGKIGKWFEKSKGFEDRLLRLLTNEVERLEEEEELQAELRRQAEGKHEAEERRRTAEEASKHWEPEKRIINSIGMEFVYIPPGTFTMGSPKKESERDRDEVQHKVTLTKGFYLQTTQVTQGQWEAVMGNNPSQLKGGDRYPVENVSWDDCWDFIKELNSNEGVELYRLPTEAEWEYACRAGSTTKYCFGDSESLLDEYAWYHDVNRLGKHVRGHLDREGEHVRVHLDGEETGTHQVGHKKPNAWGLFDMHGNVNEWCRDWKGKYPKVTVTDPTGPSSGKTRVVRGGSWCNSDRGCRSAHRDCVKPGGRGFILGFRLVRIAP